MKRFTLMLAGVLCASASFATDYYVSVEGSGEKMALLGKMPLPLPICVVKSMSIKMEMFFIFREERIMFQLKCLLFLMGILLLELLLGHLQFSQEM